MAAGILLYGVALDEADTAWAEFFESHGCKLRAATKAAAQRKRVKVKHPAFGCAVVGRPRLWFVAVGESCVLATRKEAAPVERFKIERDWNDRLRQFCGLFDLGDKEPWWYVACVGDGEHRGHKLVVS